MRCTFLVRQTKSGSDHLLRKIPYFDSDITCYLALSRTNFSNDFLYGYAVIVSPDMGYYDVFDQRVHVSPEQVHQNAKWLYKLAEEIELDSHFPPIVFAVRIARDGRVALRGVGRWLKAANRRDVCSDDELSIDGAADQAFFFVKEMSHVHQHHSDDAEGLTRMHSGIRECEALLAMQKDLLRAIKALRRRATPNDLSNALGMIEYARALDCVSAKRPNFVSPVPAGDYDRLERSVTVSLARRQGVVSATIAWTAIAIALLAILVALSAGVLSLYDNDNKGCVSSASPPERGVALPVCAPSKHEAHERVNAWIRMPTERLLFAPRSGAEWFGTVYVYAGLLFMMALPFPGFRALLKRYFFTVSSFIVRLFTFPEGSEKSGPRAAMFVGMCFLLAAICLAVWFV